MILKGNRQKHITMKTTKHVILLAVMLVLALSSCTAKKGFISKLPKQEIADVQRFAVVSDIFALDKNDNGFRSDSLSALSMKCIDAYLNKQENIEIKGRIEINDTLAQRKVNDEIRQLADIAFDNKEIVLIPIPRTIDSLLETQGKRFGLLVYATGFERYESNFWKAMSQAIIMMRGGATLNPYYDRLSMIALMIVDADKNNIAFYNNSTLRDEWPSRQYCVDRHFMELYYRYWR